MEEVNVLITWVDIVTIFLSVGALVFSIMQFCFERRRTRKEATIHAFDQLEENPSVNILFAMSKKEIDNLVQRHKTEDQRIVSQWDTLGMALPLLEHYAVGVNSKVYDIETLNRMAGNKIIRVHQNCENLLQDKRDGFGNGKNYCEFEEMVNRLKKLRNKKKQSIPEKPVS